MLVSSKEGAYLLIFRGENEGILMSEECLRKWLVKEGKDPDYAIVVVVDQGEWSYSNREGKEVIIKFFLLDDLDDSDSILVSIAERKKILS